MGIAYRVYNLRDLFLQDVYVQAMYRYAKRGYDLLDMSYRSRNYNYEQERKLLQKNLS